VHLDLLEVSLSPSPSGELFVLPHSVGLPVPCVRFPQDCGSTAAPWGHRQRLAVIHQLPHTALAYYYLYTATDLVSSISDPEHPLSLGELAVVNLPDIDVRDAPAAPFSTVLVEITPTITHCSLATVIGLGVRVRLEQALPPRFRVDVRIKEGTHSTADQVNKQLNDKERVAAALENGTLMGVLNKMLETCK
jgi:metal-sulfur cluster biosynthetic enzyme